MKNKYAYMKIFLFFLGEIMKYEENACHIVGIQQMSGKLMS